MYIVLISKQNNGDRKMKNRIHVLRQCPNTGKWESFHRNLSKDGFVKIDCTYYTVKPHEKYENVFVAEYSHY